MGYIEEIRKLVGTRPIIMAGAGVILTDPQGWILLGQRTDNGAWGIPGGSMEPGETLEETARREMLEETGLLAGALRLFGVFSGPEFFYTYPNGDQVYNVSVVYHCDDYAPGGTARPDPEEHGVFRFFSPAALPGPLSPPIRPVIAAWMREKSSGEVMVR
jgi:8-oxo-dGTP pyrophosphatase MutT (NUDIX family)